MAYILSFGCAILGAILASLAGVISERLYTHDSWLVGRSRCNSCGRALTALDLVPVISWLTTFGHCRTCRARVPYRYALAELSLAALFYAAYARFGLGIPLGFFLVALFLLAIIVLYDLRHTIVPFTLAIVLVLVSAAFAYLTANDMHQFLVVAFVAALIALGFYLLHALSRGRAMGLGDTPVAFALSLLAGQQAVSGLLFSFWIGGLIGIVILVLAPKGHRMGIEVPFVPFLAAGYLLALFTQWNPLLF